MRSAVILTALFLLTLVLLPADDRPAGAQRGNGSQEVFVTNFPEVQRVRGTVTVPEPIPHTRLDTTKALVSPAPLGDTSSYTDGGVLRADGFAKAAVGIAGQVQGRLVAGAPIGALLLPDEPDILATFRTHGVTTFAVRVEAQATPSESGLFHSPTAHVELAFPRYRVYFYNGTPKTSEVTLYAYLKSS